MNDAGNGTGKAGSPADAATAWLQAAVAGATHPAPEPSSDPRVWLAFALGWHMAELYRPDQGGRDKPAAPDDLPGLGRLGTAERMDIAVKQVEAGLARLGDAIRAVGLKVPDTTALRGSIGSPVDVRCGAVRDLHVQVLATLTAADFRLGKAYGLGRSLADTCRNRANVEEVQAEFKPHRIAKLRTWLDDLASTFPDHAAKSVSDSLGRWAKALMPEDGANPPELDAALGALPRQGQLWRALLSGEKSGPDMLEINNYLDAATGLLITMRGIARRFILRLPLLAAAIVILFAGGIALIVTTKTTASFVAGAAGILASLGLSWKSVGGALGGVTAKLERQLWGAELDTAIADAITLLPDPAKFRQSRGDKTHVRRSLAREVISGVTSRSAARAAAPAQPEESMRTTA